MHTRTAGIDATRMTSAGGPRRNGDTYVGSKVDVWQEHVVIEVFSGCTLVNEISVTNLLSTHLVRRSCSH